MKVSAYCDGLILEEVPEEDLSIILYMPDMIKVLESCDVITTVSIDDDKIEIIFEWVDETSETHKTKTIVLEKKNKR